MLVHVLHVRVVLAVDVHVIKPVGFSLQPPQTRSTHQHVSGPQNTRGSSPRANTHRHGEEAGRVHEVVALVGEVVVQLPEHGLHHVIGGVQRVPLAIQQDHGRVHRHPHTVPLAVVCQEL
jgi:hypothetical protein